MQIKTPTKHPRRGISIIVKEEEYPTIKFIEHIKKFSENDTFFIKTLEINQREGTKNYNRYGSQLYQTKRKQNFS